MAPEDLELIIERAVKELYTILGRTPKFYLEEDERTKKKYERVTVVFRDGEAELETSGKGAYDDVAGCRPKYSAPTTARQVIGLVGQRKEEPVALRYRFVNENTPDMDSVAIEITYEFAKKVFNGEIKGKARMPYRIVGETDLVDRFMDVG